MIMPELPWALCLGRLRLRPTYGPLLPLAVSISDASAAAAALTRRFGCIVSMRLILIHGFTLQLHQKQRNLLLIYQVSLRVHLTEVDFRKWLDREEPYGLPSQLFSPDNGSYLRYLDIRTVSLQLPSDFKGFRNLKSLTLVDVSITDKDVQWVLSKCNLLEFFAIAYCIMVTSIRVLHPLDLLKHLVVDRCPELKEIELCCSPTTLMYAGEIVRLLKFASTSRLTNINVRISHGRSALSYIITGLPRA
jgi:hypothetical protein